MPPVALKGIKKSKTTWILWKGVCQTKKVCLLPVVSECISDGLADDLTVLLQGVECILDCLVNSFLDGATYLLDLVDAATWLQTGMQR